MDRLIEYRRIIRDLIAEYAEYGPSVGDVRTDVVFDEAGDHYMLVHSGWVGPMRVYENVLHMQIRDGKVWVEHNGTEDAIASRLVEAGIPRDKVVLGFKPPSARVLTGFAAS